MKRKITFEDSDKEIQKKYFNVYKEDKKKASKAPVLPYTAPFFFQAT